MEYGQVVQVLVRVHQLQISWRSSREPVEDSEDAVLRGDVGLVDWRHLHMVMIVVVVAMSMVVMSMPVVMMVVFVIVVAAASELADGALKKGA